MKFQKTIAATLSAAMLLSVSSFAATPSDFSDFPADWSTDALTHAVENGLLNGSDGKINAKGTLTRAQMAAIVNRAFGAEKAADLTRFVDMLQSAWYYNDMGKAVQMGTFVGSGDKLNPEAPITREQAFAVLARAFALSDGSASALSKFSDASSVSSWAVGSTAALVEAGYINGSDGKLNPKGYMTRAEFAQMMDNLVKAYVTSAQTITEVPAGNVVVRASGATLKNITVDGDLVIADGATSVTLDGVTVKGNIILRGGANGVTITGATSANGVTVENPNGTTVINGDGSKLGTVHVKTDLTVNGTLSNASVDEKATLTVNQGGKVGSVTVNAPGSQVKGSGTVTTVQANASNTTVTTPNTKVTAGTGTSNVKAGDKTVEPGKTETVGTASSSGGSSSGGGSSRSDYSYVLMNIPYNEFYKAELSENAPEVDAVSSATMNKTRSGLAAGSYHVNTDGTDITGVIYPVRVKTSDLSGLTQVTDSSSVSITTTLKGKTSTTDYTGKDALFESASHSYYYLSSTPSYYKEATLTDGKWSFGKATGAASEGTATIAKFKTSGHHTDYEIKVESDKITKGQKVYAVVVTDTDGNSYGLRHVAEIWHAIELGFNADSPIVGKTIKTITYYTDDGVIELNLNEALYVPAQAATAKVAEADFSAGETKVTLSKDLPSDFDAKYSVTVADKESNFFKYENGKITWDKNGEAPSGTYQLTITDQGGKYAPITAQINLNVYAYAAVPYDEYWKNEDVYLNGSDWTASSDVADRTTTNKDGSVTKEHDKGAFDAVSRATQNHGLHRGSFQQSVVIHTADKDYHPVSWPAEGKGNVFVDADGNQYDKTQIGITSYDITGIKYVPVKVNASDFKDFSEKYAVTKNGETMQGGYSENNLTAYTAVAAVDKDTNGLKVVTKGRDNKYTFGARQAGTTSGIKDQSLKTANAGITAAVKDYSGSFGEMLRVDLDNTKDNTKYYGDLGSHMQTVVWKYYGSGDEVLATYGTKFAADDWMHKMMGIQLGLTDSLRFQLPADTDGTGKWTVTVYALGYSDTTYAVNVTSANLPQPATAMTDEQKAQLTSLKDAANELLDAKDNAETKDEYESVTDKAWADLEEHYNEAVALLGKADATSAEAEELLGELPGLIAPVKLAPVTETYTALFPVLTNSTYHDYWNTSITEFFKKNGYTNVSNTKIEEYAESLRTMCNGTKYGQDAVDKFGDGSNGFPNGFQFNCTFINGVDTIQFEGNKISGTNGGTEVFSHQYTYEGKVTVGEGEMSFTGDLYKTNDANAGEFTYFIMCDDTPGTTYHIEFRYGSDLDALKGYVTGKYAYWLAAGIPTDADDTLIKNCIDLFVSENLEGTDPTQPEEPDQPTTTIKYGQYAISEEDLDDPYTVKVKVTINSDGTIALIEDNDTNTVDDSNDSFWSKAMNGNPKKGIAGLFETLLGKNVSQIDSVDAVSGATISSNAIKNAVKNALND